MACHSRSIANAAMVLTLAMISACTQTIARSLPDSTGAANALPKEALFTLRNDDTSSGTADGYLF